MNPTNRSDLPAGWGPQPPDQRPARPWWRLPVSLLLFVLAVSSGRILALLIICAIAYAIWWQWRRCHHPRTRAEVLDSIHGQTDAGVHLGLTRAGGRRVARAERAVLVLGPPRSGKTSAVIIPTLLTHPGATVSASTKPDVMHATHPARGRTGRVWRFDPTGSDNPPAGVRELRWSPVSAAHDWDGALRMARAMVTGSHVGAGTTDGTHWSRRAQALLAPLLHAAAVSHGGIAEVAGWVLAHDPDTPGTLLEQAGAGLAAGVLAGVARTETRERSSIFSAAADALDAYTSASALAAAQNPNFDPDRFVRSRDTIYIDAPAERQHLAAPLVCGLLAEIREATYRAHHAGQLANPVLFALDEVANIAPLEELPAIASEGGGQGLLLLAALQDLSQARARWGTVAHGFLTLFGTKLILPGIADHRTLEDISTALGEYDRILTSITHTRVRGQWGPQRGQTASIHRQRVLSPGEVANIPAGHALHLDGIRWELLTLTPAHRTEPWATLTTPNTTAAPPAQHRSGDAGTVTRTWPAGGMDGDASGTARDATGTAGDAPRPSTAGAYSVALPSGTAGTAARHGRRGGSC